MLKRMGLLAITNMAVVATITLVSGTLSHYKVIPEGWTDYSSLMIFCSAWGMVGSFISLMMSRKAAKKSMDIYIARPGDNFSDIVEMVERLAKQAGLPRAPEFGVYDSSEINAFATGPSKRRSLVAVSTGLLNSMNYEEIEAVVAHEISHIQNGDMVTMTLLQGVVNSFVMFFARIGAFAIHHTLGDEEDDIGWFAYLGMVMVLEVVFGFMGNIITSYFSRSREYRADKGAAKLVGARRMAATLERLKVSPIGGSDRSIASLKIYGKSGLLTGLLATHPPLQKRIDALSTEEVSLRIAA